MFTSPCYPTLEIVCCQKAANKARSRFVRLALVPCTLLEPPGEKPLCPHCACTMLRTTISNVNQVNGTDMHTLLLYKVLKQLPIKKELATPE